ncbi:MAG TPA: DUF86 domain-containing protein [Candidatus Pacearchaeota archaeon]|nr:DUF86 domain-containing protein [Candidatus Pacearchaeota archaeon]
MLKYKLYIKDILDSIKKIEDSLKGKNKDDFDKEDILKDATYMRIQVIGESTNKISKEIKSKYKLNWEKIERTRNIISHAYSYINSEIIWELIKIELPKLKEVINEISKKEK